MPARVFVITGPSGVGKGTLIGELRRRVPGLSLSVSATTRDPRKGEEDGVDYHFLSTSDFGSRAEAGDFLEYATFSGNRYGTLREEVERTLAAGESVVLEIEVQGARQVRASAMGDDAVLIFIAPPGAGDLRERLAGRGTDSADAIERRLETAKQELEAKQEFKHVIVNDDVERAAAELERIVREELSG